jgi:hypothetical protein
MTAPSTPPVALPVVACWVTTAGAPDVTTREIERITDAPSHNALAVPLALFEDEGFVLRVSDRAWENYYRANDGTTRPGTRKYLDAIAAELRARANAGGGA